LIETRPEMIMRSAWRGVARKASEPMRAESTRLATMAIISMAQQARPNVAGNMLFALAQFRARSRVVVMTRSVTYFSSAAFSSSGPRSRSCARCRLIRRFSGLPAFSRLTISIRALLSATRR
jgi:hypothetical protein